MEDFSLEVGRIGPTWMAKKICYDYCHLEFAYYKMFEALIEDIG